MSYIFHAHGIWKRNAFFGHQSAIRHPSAHRLASPDSVRAGHPSHPELSLKQVSLHLFRRACMLMRRLLRAAFLAFRRFSAARFVFHVPALNLTLTCALVQDAQPSYVPSGELEMFYIQSAAKIVIRSLTHPRHTSWQSPSYTSQM